ncbi:hypothetical protein BB560_003634, partial [Smittium megazygosporum]
MHIFKSFHTFILAVYLGVVSNFVYGATISAGSIINIFAPVSIKNGVVVGKQASVSVPNILSSLNNPNYKPAVYTDATISKIGYTPNSVRGLTTSGFNLLSLLSGCQFHLENVDADGADTKTLVAISICIPIAGLTCKDSGYSYNDYELIDNGICVIQDNNGSETQTCYEIDESVTSFVDYPYEYPDGAEGMMRRVCTIDRNADEGDQVVCETDPNAVCEPIGPVNPCKDMDEDTSIFVNDNELCKCYSYNDYELIDNGICVIQDNNGSETQTCYEIDESVTSFVDYPYEYPDGAEGMMRRVCTIDRNADEGDQVVCETDPNAVCEPIGPVNPCKDMDEDTSIFVNDNELCKYSGYSYNDYELIDN